MCTGRSIGQNSVIKTTYKASNIGPHPGKIKLFATNTLAPGPQLNSEFIVLDKPPQCRCECCRRRRLYNDSCSGIPSIPPPTTGSPIAMASQTTSGIPSDLTEHCGDGLQYHLSRSWRVRKNRLESSRLSTVLIRPTALFQRCVQLWTAIF
jgi:hypothetical protein